MTAPKYIDVPISDRRWIEWAKAWPEDLRSTAKERMVEYRAWNLGRDDTERAYNAFVTYRSMAPRDLGGPQHTDPQVLTPIV